MWRHCTWFMWIFSRWVVKRLHFQIIQDSFPSFAKMTLKCPTLSKWANFRTKVNTRVVCDHICESNMLKVSNCAPVSGWGGLHRWFCVWIHWIYFNWNTDATWNTKWESDYMWGFLNLANRFFSKKNVIFSVHILYKSIWENWEVFPPFRMLLSVFPKRE